MYDMIKIIFATFHKKGLSIRKLNILKWLWYIIVFDNKIGLKRINTKDQIANIKIDKSIIIVAKPPFWVLFLT